MSLEVFALDPHIEKYAWYDIFDPLAKLIKRAQFLGYDQVTFINPKTFVSNIKSKVKKEKIKKLVVLDHGFKVNYYDDKGEVKATGCQIEFGDERVTNGNFSSYSKLFGNLTPLFDEEAEAVFLHCNAGHASSLLLKFAQLWNVPITGSLHFEVAAGFLNYGDTYVTVKPDGTGKKHKKRPV